MIVYRIAEWITEYHQSRPGLEILQQRIDDFMTAYEEQEEQVFFRLLGFFLAMLHLMILLMSVQLWNQYKHTLTSIMSARIVLVVAYLHAAKQLM